MSVCVLHATLGIISSSGFLSLLFLSLIVVMEFLWSLYEKAGLGFIIHSEAAGQ